MKLEDCEKFLLQQFQMIGKFNSMMMVFYEDIHSWQIIPYNPYPTSPLPQQYNVVVVYKIKPYHLLTEEEKENRVAF